MEEKNTTLLDYIKSNNPNMNLVNLQELLANDIDSNRNVFRRLFVENKIDIYIDPLVYKDNDKVRLRGVIKGFSWITLLVSLVLVFFSWKIAIVFFVITIILRVIASYILRKEEDRISELYRGMIQSGDLNQALSDIWYLYGSSRIGLKTDVGSAIMPKKPSDCLNPHTFLA